ncbi:MAG: sigma-70 family RNA polymerase sigma factor, partial [Rhodothermales bacterium]
ADLKDTQQLKSFMMKAAIFELQDFYRGRYSTREHLYDPEHPPHTGHAETESGEKVDVEQVLSVLSEKAREIIELREYGYRYEEIAQKLGTTEAAVKMQVLRAFEKIREIFHDR